MRITLVLLAVAGLLVAAAPVSAKVKRLEAKMSGANEIPAADPDGSGNAEFRFNRAKKKVCFEIRVKNISTALAAHIHKGGKSVASGAIVVPLFENQSSKTKFTGCAKNVKKSLISAILKHPRSYYVNVHTADFGAGAIRGQLRRP
jgi:hypothetical protein